MQAKKSRHRFFFATSNGWRDDIHHDGYGLLWVPSLKWNRAPGHKMNETAWDVQNSSKLSVLRMILNRSWESNSPEPWDPRPVTQLRWEGMILGRFFVEPPRLENEYLGVSKNRGGPPKSSILIGFSIINHPFWGFSPYFWKHPFGNHQVVLDKMQILILFLSAKRQSQTLGTSTRFYSSRMTNFWFKNFWFLFQEFLIPISLCQKIQISIDLYKFHTTFSDIWL